MTEEQIKKRLEDSFQGAEIEVFDMTGGQDHYQVSIKSSFFKGMSRIQQHKTVMAVFDKELKTGEIHAFTLKVET